MSERLELFIYEHSSNFLLPLQRHRANVRQSFSFAYNFCRGFFCSLIVVFHSHSQRLLQSFLLSKTASRKSSSNKYSTEQKKEIPDSKLKKTKCEINEWTNEKYETPFLIVWRRNFCEFFFSLYCSVVFFVIAPSLTIYPLFICLFLQFNLI